MTTARCILSLESPRENDPRADTPAASNHIRHDAVVNWRGDLEHCEEM